MCRAFFTHTYTHTQITRTALRSNGPRAGGRASAVRGKRGTGEGEITEHRAALLQVGGGSLVWRPCVPFAGWWRKSSMATLRGLQVGGGKGLPGQRLRPVPYTRLGPAGTEARGGSGCGPAVDTLARKGRSALRVRGRPVLAPASGPCIGPWLGLGPGRIGPPPHSDPCSGQGVAGGPGSRRTSPCTSIGPCIGP